MYKPQNQLAPLTTQQNALFEQWYHLPKAVAKSLLNINAVRTNFEEYLQIGRLTLVKCVRGYIPNENASFKTYAYKSILNTLIRFISKDKVITTPNKCKGKDCSSINYENENILGREYDCGDNKDTIALTLKNITVRDRFILTEKFIKGKTLKEIGDECCLSKQRIAQIIDAAKAKILRRYYEDYHS